MLSIARSPIKKDIGIKNIIKFKDPYNENIDFYLYNLKKLEYNNIIIMFENKKINNNIKIILKKLSNYTKNLYYYLEYKLYKYNSNFNRK